MSQSLRQSELFAGADWQVLYRAFTQINFNASDPASINRALREYIQINYAEDFSDWIESSEFVAIIDLLAYLAGTLAFKTDINARENFLESAEARESILRLARFLSYNPRSNYPARGLLKLQEIQTSDNVEDAFGVNLQNLRVIWNNPDDPDWFERMVLILNSAFVSTNQFGVPLKSGVIAGTRSQLYRFNALFGNASLGFTAPVSGSSMNFEFINSDFDDELGYFERAPDLNQAMHLVYRTDGNGNGSARTGFFLPFKQGILQRQDVVIPYPEENRLIEVPVDNINETDVWVQSLTDTGELWYEWDKVPAVFSENITYNSIDPNKRNIFSVITRDRDQVSLRFSDGRFGNAPVGPLRYWYRTSNGLQYQIRPAEMERISIALPYVNRRGIPHTLTMVFALEEGVSNSTPRETEEQVRRRAPQVYATQNRMVSGEDYNTYPLQHPEAKKIKALVRVYSGHSRFIDLNDPTGSYQDLNVFADDGLFYKERTTSYVELPLSENKTPEEMTSLYIQPMLQSIETVNVVQDYLMRQSSLNFIQPPPDMMWKKAADGRFFSTGSFSQSSTYLRPGATLLFEKGNSAKWISVLGVSDDPTLPSEVGVPGPVSLADPLDSDWKVKAIIPAYVSYLSSDIRDEMERRMRNDLSYTLWFDYNPGANGEFWSVRTPESIETQPQVVGTAIKLCSVEYVAGSIWRITVPGLRYVFESLKQVRFYFDGQKAVDYDNQTQHQDLIRILRYNADLHGTGGLGRDYDLALAKTVLYTDGYADPRRIQVIFRDRDEDGNPDDPDTYFQIATAIREDGLLFWARNDQGLYDAYYDMWVWDREEDRLSAYDVPLGTVGFQLSGTYPETFWMFTEEGWVPQWRKFRFARGRGPNVAKKWLKDGNVQDLDAVPTGSLLNFQWKHFAPSDRRIDPAKTNVIDTFVLTTEYDFLTRQWIRNGAEPAERPAPLTELDLRLTFGEFEEFKMFSDEMVWRPVKYKLLFGDTAEPELRAQFKVVKVPGASMSDGEIKSRVIRAFEEYFDADSWDFGETFYYTELAAYVHWSLRTQVASIVIVPEVANAAFGDGFEVKCRTDELFISTATVNDITIIDSNTPTNLRIR